MTQGTVSFPLGGGLDLISPPGKMKPGCCIAALNYEPTGSGYQRFTGFERYDGHPAPSDATWYRLNYTNGGNNDDGTAPVAANSIRGNGVNTIVGYVLATVTTTGSWAAGTAAGYIVATGVIGTPTGTLHVMSIPLPGATWTAGTQTLEYDFGATLNATYLAAARTVTRNNIGSLGASIRGIWGFDGNIFAVADNDPTTPTAGIFYKASTAGWVAVTNLVRVDFTSDTGAGQNIPLTKDHFNVSNSSGGTSKGHIETAVITGTVGTVNTGYLLLSGYTAATFTAGAQIIYKAATAIQLGTTTAAATTTATIPAGGRYFFLNHNFYGSEDRAAMYMVNGVGKAMVYNGVGYAEIATGMTTDTPTRLAEHQGSLFLSFPGGSLQSSQVGEPQSFDPILGASEISVGSDITDLISATQSALTILADTSISVLYGHDSSDYQLETLAEEDGNEAISLPYTAQRLGNVIYMDNTGIRSIAATSAYGNFNFGSLSQLIEPLLRDYRKDGVSPVASLTWKRKDQYWAFFDNGTALVLYGLKNPQILPLNLGFTVTCATHITINGVERVFVGTSTGYVMELDKGTSFDGAVIEHYFRLPFNTFGSPEIEKRAHKVTLNLEASGATTLSVDVDFDYGSVVGLASQQLSLTTGGGALDGLGSNEAYYASQIETQAEAYIDGVARNFSLKVSGSTSTEDPHTATSVTYHLSQRGLRR